MFHVVIIIAKLLDDSVNFADFLTSGSTGWLLSTLRMLHKCTLLNVC